MLKTIAQLDKYKLVLGFVSVVVTVASLWLLNQHGALTTPDSANYISTAAHIVSGRGVTQYDGSPLWLWSPFYPVVVAAAEFVSGADPRAVVPPVNSILFGLTVFLAGLLLLKHLKSKMLALLGTLAVVVAPAIVWNDMMAMSEVLFIFFLLVYFIGLDLYRENGRLLWLVITAGAVGLASITRYAGVIAIPVGALSIFLFCRGNWRSKVVPIFLFVVIAALPFVLWDIRSRLVAGHSILENGPQIHTWAQSLSATYNTILAWYIPVGVGALWATLLLFGVVILCGVAFLVREPKTRLHAYWSANGSLLIFVIAYLCMFNYASATTLVDLANDRLMSPIYIPLTLLLLGLFEEAAYGLTFRFSARIISTALGVALVVWLLYPIGLSRSAITTYFDQGWGMSNRVWRNSPTIQYLAANPSIVSDCTVYSNAADVLYLVANLEVRGLPDRSWNDYIKTHGTIFKPPAGKMCIVWSKLINRTYLVPLETYASLKTFETRKKFSDGGIYVISQQ